MIPIGKAKIQRPGQHLTITAFSKMVGVSLQAAELLAQEGIDVEVINLRSIKPLDRDTIAASVRKTHRLLSVEEGWPQSGVGSEIVTSVMEMCFDDLDAPPARVTGTEIPTPYSANLEAQAFPQVAEIVRMAKQVMGK